MEEVISEELMALEAIFYDSFSRISDNRFRVRIDPAEDQDTGADSASVPPPLFLEVALLEGYPNVPPEFDLSNLNNSNYPEIVKKRIMDGLLQQVLCYIGDSLHPRLPTGIYAHTVYAFQLHFLHLFFFIYPPLIMPIVP